MEHYFTTYVRTKLLFQHRFKGLKKYDTVRIYVYELKKLNMDEGKLLYALKHSGEIDYDDKGNFKPLKDGPIDPSLLEITKRRPKATLPLSPLHKWMMQQLLHVKLVGLPVKEIPVYFRTFMKFRDTQLEAFFTVDAFSHRVHTPIVNLKHEFRKNIRFHGEKLASLDVEQMQPTILAKILSRTVGVNPFSTAIFNGEDVYVLLQQNANLGTRPEAKKFLFQLIFGKPMNDITKVIKGDSKWVDWINNYKKTDEPNNPHRKDRHTNLAWLLQYSEVKVMSDIWSSLMNLDIPFLSIHDEVLCRVSDRHIVKDVMEKELVNHFPKFKINLK